MSRDDERELSADTRAIRAGREASGASLATPLFASSVWESTSMDDAHRRATAVRADEFYGRYANPTVRSFEHTIADLEHAEDAMAFGSGMGAIASTVPPDHHPATTTHASMSPDEQAASGVTEGLVRVSVGLEDPADLIADLDQALG